MAEPRGTLLEPRERRRPGSAAAQRGGPAFQAFSSLYIGFIVAPLVAGIDKFFNYLVDWSVYLAPTVAGWFGGQAELVMRGVGVVEIAAGLLVAVKPSVGGLVVAAWLGGIIVNLMLIPGYYDIVLRDFGLALGALAMARLARSFGR